MMCLTTCRRRSAVKPRVREESARGSKTTNDDQKQPAPKPQVRPQIAPIRQVAETR